MIKYIFYFVLFVLVVDVMGFIAWRVSEQRPPDSYHAGVITESIIRVIK